MFSRRDRWGLWLCALLHGATLYGFAAARFQSVHQRTFDLALYARIAWGIAHGDLTTRVLATTPLGTHLSLVLAPLGLAGRALSALGLGGSAPTVHVLLVAQAACAALCVFPLARIGARHLGRRGALLAVLGWLLYPNVFHVATYEFHPGTLALLPICWAFDALERGHVRHLSLCCAGMLACREDFGAMAIVFALLAHVRLGRPHARTLALACLGYSAAAIWLVLRNAPVGGSLDLHFGVWGGSPLGVVRTLFEDPGRVIAHFRAPARLHYLPRLLAVVSFFPLRAAWLLWPAAPVLALNLLSEFPTACAQYSHYLTPAVPALVVAGVVGTSAIQQRAFRVLWVLTLVLSHFALGGSPLSHDFDARAFQADDASDSARAVLAQIRPSHSAQAPDPLLPHLAERTTLRRAPPPDPTIDMVVLDVSHRSRFARREDLLRTSEEPVIQAFSARGTHGLRVYAPPYALFERGLPPRSAPAAAACFVVDADRVAAQGVPLTRCLSALDATLQGERVTFRVRVHASCRADLALRFGPKHAPWRVELPCDGRISPAHWRAGDVLRSSHLLQPKELAAARAGELWLGALRADGKAVEEGDPLAIPLPVVQHPAP
ncbi:MAG TPA: DUF2079 domain-containing protein [Polyangiales bacterium]